MSGRPEDPDDDEAFLAELFDGLTVSKVERELTREEQEIRDAVLADLAITDKATPAEFRARCEIVATASDKTAMIALHNERIALQERERREALTARNRAASLKRHADTLSDAQVLRLMDRYGSDQDGRPVSIRTLHERLQQAGKAVDRERLGRLRKQRPR